MASNHNDEWPGLPEEFTVQQKAVGSKKPISNKTESWGKRTSESVLSNYQVQCAPKSVLQTLSYT